MRVAFYRVNQPKATFKDKLIAWWTSHWSEKLNGRWRLGFSHVELLFFDGVMVSSSPREGCVRGRPHVFNPEVWEYVEVSGLDETKARFLAQTQLGKPYDWWGVAGFVLAMRDNEKRWFCSELVSRLLQIAGCVRLGEFNPGRISPNRLYKLLQRR